VIEFSPKHRVLQWAEEDDMKEVRLSESETTLSAIVDQAQGGEPAVLIRDGKPEAVVVGYEMWQRLTRPSFADLLLSFPVEPGDIPERDRRPWASHDFET
jgi:antitoxin Phd